MLSTPDLQCPCDISQLKSSSSSDERASDDNNDVDLFKSGLDDNIIPLPKFSIRDYVFDTRGKDIKTNWPFSQKNLQLCLKHGVEDVLPPFQSLDSVRNPSIMERAAEDIHNSDVRLSGLRDHSVGQKLTVGSEEDKEFPSTTASQSCSDINSVPLIKRPYMEPEAEYFPGFSTEDPEFASRASTKVKGYTQNPIKKCKLIVKLSNIAAPKSDEDLAVNACVISETMASKVCPVCKTFSSSSNTTLNAHIDQCLYGDSTVKRTTNSKESKHRINKPRKTRLMVDIYETALHSTLDDLDRRNGTSWASTLGFPARDLEACAEEKTEKYCLVDIEEANEEGAVYIDSNGTKLCVLSKLTDPPPNSNAKSDCGPRKLVNRDKVSKLVLKKKKKNLLRKHKLLKDPSIGQRSCSPGPSHYRTVDDGQQTEFPLEGDKKEDLTAPIAYDQRKSDDMGMIKQWVSSKRTDIKKKNNLDHEKQNQDKVIKNLKVRTTMSPLGDTLVKRISTSNSAMPSNENKLSPSESRRRKENLLGNSHDVHMEQPCLRTRPRLSLFRSQDCHGKKDGPSIHDDYTDPPNGTEDHLSSQITKKMALNISPAINVESSHISSRPSQNHAFSSEDQKSRSLKRSSLDHAIPCRSKKFSSLRKNLLSDGNASVPESKKNLRRKHLDFKNPRLHYSSGSDEEAVVSRSAIYRQDKLGKKAAQMGKASSRSLINRTSVLKIRKKREGFINSGKGDVAFKGSERLSESTSHGVGKNGDSSMDGNNPVGSNVLKEAGIRDGFISELTHKVADREEAFIAFSKSLDSAFPGLDVPSNYIKAYEDHHYSSELVLGGEQELFCANKVGKDLVTRDTDMIAELMDANNESQGNYFVDVDPIPIPGPPGSFLPSPRRMGSEELQGNSSLTTSRVQSSEDERELIDMESSDSPISATSMVLNPLSFIKGSSHGDQLEHAASTERELNSDASRGDTILYEMSARGFKNIRPCCCSRKVPENGSHSFEAKFPTCNDRESPSPSTSNPVLRLMGKNLMVVKDEKLSPLQTRPTESSIVNDQRQGLQLCVKNNEHYSFHHASSRDPFIVDNMQAKFPGQHFDFNSSSGLKIPSDFRTQLSDHPSTVMFVPSKSFGGSLTSSLKYHNNAGRCHLIPGQIGSEIRPRTPRTYDIEKVGNFVPHFQSADSYGSKHNETIVIDDSPESEVGKAINATHYEINMEAWESSVGISASMGPVNPFFTYRPRGYPNPPCSGSPMVQTGNSQVPPSRESNSYVSTWNSLKASLPSASLSRSLLYSSPGFS
ncbi:hypothetical protein BUALT_Bualt03G0162100 [Buddleja alternifolia]|uniref:Uncharacterized protein n=1 Tax=Buddleja alternifolia TaxID=168488 RepID=A0AAV6XYK0_9LAMI|nr:hypothetical protein BUALT_Bualt03G0162100 [Buddleja alternifolia]